MLRNSQRARGAAATVGGWIYMMFGAATVVTKSLRPTKVPCFMRVFIARPDSMANECRSIPNLMKVAAAACLVAKYGNVP